MIKLATLGHCAKTIQGRFTRREDGSHRLYYIAAAGEGPEQGEPLFELPSLSEARLTILALASRKDNHIHQFTIMIEGKTPDERQWAAAIHLEDDRAKDEQDRKGGGACSHAASHCHVGPTLDHEPKVRVPFPAVGPAGALDWLLSIVIPDWEPAPWPQVVAALSPRVRTSSQRI